MIADFVKPPNDEISIVDFLRSGFRSNLKASFREDRRSGYFIVCRI